MIDPAGLLYQGCAIIWELYRNSELSQIRNLYGTRIFKISVSVYVAKGISFEMIYLHKNEILPTFTDLIGAVFFIHMLDCTFEGFYQHFLRSFYQRKRGYTKE